MIGGELFPLVSGLAIGAAAAFSRRAYPRTLMVVIVWLAAFVATIASGEYLVSWAYLLLDATIVLAAACMSFAVVVRMTKCSAP